MFRKQYFYLFQRLAKTEKKALESEKMQQSSIQYKARDVKKQDGTQSVKVCVLS